jgi:hypothetical protein
LSIATFREDDRTLIAVINERESVVTLYTFFRGSSFPVQHLHDLNLGTECYSVQITPGENGPLLWIVTGAQNHIRVFSWKSKAEYLQEEVIAVNAINNHGMLFH